MAVHTALPSFGAAAAGNLEHAWHAQHPTAAAGFDAGQTTALVPLAGAHAAAGGAGDSSAGNQEQPGMYYDAEEAEQLQDAGAAALQVTASKPGKREIKNKTPPTKTHEVHIQCDSLYPQRADGRFYKIADAKSDFRPFMVMLQVPAQLHVMACMCAGCLADAQQHCAGASTKLHLLQLCFCPYLLTAYVYCPAPQLWLIQFIAARTGLETHKAEAAVKTYTQNKSRRVEAYYILILKKPYDSLDPQVMGTVAVHAGWLRAWEMSLAGTGADVALTLTLCAGVGCWPTATASCCLCCVLWSCAAAASCCCLLLPLLIVQGLLLPATACCRCALLCAVLLYAAV
jgi:hypothetical protein